MDCGSGVLCQKLKLDEEFVCESSCLLESVNTSHVFASARAEKLDDFSWLQEGRSPVISRLCDMLWMNLGDRKYSDDEQPGWERR